MVEEGVYIMCIFLKHRDMGKVWGGFNPQDKSSSQNMKEALGQWPRLIVAGLWSNVYIDRPMHL